MIIRKTKHWLIIGITFFSLNIGYFYYINGLSSWPLYLFFAFAILFFIVFYLSHYLEVSNNEIIFRSFPFQKDLVKMSDVEYCEFVFGYGGPFTPIKRFEIKVKKSKTLKINVKHYNEKDFKKFMKLIEENIKKLEGR